MNLITLSPHKRDCILRKYIIRSSYPISFTSAYFWLVHSIRASSRQYYWQYQQYVADISSYRQSIFKMIYLRIVSAMFWQKKFGHYLLPNSYTNNKIWILLMPSLVGRMIVALFYAVTVWEQLRRKRSFDLDLLSSWLFLILSLSFLVRFVFVLWPTSPEATRSNRSGQTQARSLGFRRFSRCAKIPANMCLK